MDKKKVDFCLDWIKKINDSCILLNENRVEALKFYRSEKDILKNKEGRSSATSTDLMDAIEWLKPALIEMFTSGNEIANLQPTSEEDVEDIRKLKQLVNYQIKIRNPWYTVFHDALDDAAKMKLGVLKYQWRKEEKHIDREYEGLTEEEYQAKLAEEGVTVLSVEAIPVAEGQNIDTLESIPVYEYNVSVRYTVKDSFPLIEAVPCNEFGLMYYAKDVKSTPFVFHRISMEKWKIIELYGKDKFNKIKATMEKYDNRIDNDVEEARFSDLGGKDFIYDDDNKIYHIYECYYVDSDTGIPWISTLCGDQILHTEKNEYDCPPFVIMTLVRDGHKAYGYSMHDLTKKTQLVKTAMLRQILDNVYVANNRRYFGDAMRINMKDYLNNNRPGGFIRTDGDPRGIIMEEPNAPLPPEVFAFYELLNTEKDYHSGIPRSYQGVSKKELNKTWRGQNQQVSQASQRVGLMARNIAETCIVPLINAIIALNIKFMDSEVNFRYLNEDINISPDNLVGKYDVIVNIGTGTQDKEQTIVYMQQLIALFMSLSSAGIPIVNAQGFHTAVIELLEAMGKKNTHDFVADPETNKMVMALIQIVLQSGMVQQNPQIGMLVQKLSAAMGLGIGEGAQPTGQPAQARQPTNQAMVSGGGENFG